MLWLFSHVALKDPFWPSSGFHSGVVLIVVCFSWGYIYIFVLKFCPSFYEMLTKIHVHFEVIFPNIVQAMSSPHSFLDK